MKCRMLDHFGKGQSVRHAMMSGEALFTDAALRIGICLSRDLKLSLRLFQRHDAPRIWDARQASRSGML